MPPVNTLKISTYFPPLERKAAAISNNKLGVNIKGHTHLHRKPQQYTTIQSTWTEGKEQQNVKCQRTELC